MSQVYLMGVITAATAVGAIGVVVVGLLFAHLAGMI